MLRGSLLLALALAGCAATPRFDASTVESTELVDVPFFPQTDYQCGPAALATILAYEGVPADPADLAPEVYVEGLRGSLQAELFGATRRHGLIPYPLEPDTQALFAELASGKPVLVLQNLGFERLPVWHYAVAVGFDADKERVLLRSGTERRRSEPLKRFLRSWGRADRWAFVAVEPGEMPATATPARYVRALAGAQNLLEADSADAAFAAALEHWPRDEVVLFAAASHDADARRWPAAAAEYRSLLALEPANAAARNNLANVLAEQGCRTEALRQARAALDSLAPDSPLRPAIQDTVDTLAAGGSGESEACRANPGGR